MSRANRLLFCILCATLFCLLTFQRAISTGGLYGPERDHDGVYFEAVALNLSNGGYFGVSLDEKWREPYLTSPERHYSIEVLLRYQKEISLQGNDGQTAYRPPLYPFIVSILYRIFGRDFALVRSLQILACGLSFFLISRLLSQYRISYVIIAFALALLDKWLFAFSLLYLSETLSHLLLTILIIWLIRFENRASFFNSTILGLVYGLLILTRHLFLFWWLIFIGLSIFRKQKRIMVLHSAFVASAVFLPWFVRNIYVTDSFMPLGTQGGIILGMTYNDRTFDNYCNWTVEGHGGFISNIETDKSKLEREVFLSQYGTAKAKEWFHKNPGGILVCPILRIASLYWIHTDFYKKCLVVFGILGFFFLPSPALKLTSLFCVLGHTIAIGITTNNENGRYLFSLAPILILNASVGLGNIYAFLYKTCIKLKSGDLLKERNSRLIHM